MKKVRMFAAGLVLFALLLVIGIAVQGIQESNIKKEPFAGSSAPTRATDCKCLPGYIPSNKDDSNGGTVSIVFVGGRNIWVFTPKQSNDIYVIDNDNSCGLVSGEIDKASPSIPRMNLDDAMKKMYKGVLSCDTLKTLREASPITTDVFFCKNLAIPGKHRPCY